MAFYFQQEIVSRISINKVYLLNLDSVSYKNLFKEEKGKHFDPKLIDIFFENLDEFLKIRDNFKDS